MRIQEISAYSLEQAINTAETEYNFINVKDATDFFYQSKLDFEHFFDANQDKFEDQCAIICIEKGSYKENNHRISHIRLCYRILSQHHISIQHNCGSTSRRLPSKRISAFPYVRILPLLRAVSS